MLPIPTGDAPASAHLASIPQGFDEHFPSKCSQKSYHPGGRHVTWDESLQVRYYAPGSSPLTRESQVTQAGPVRYTALAAGVTKGVGCHCRGSGSYFATIGKVCLKSEPRRRRRESKDRDQTPRSELSYTSTGLLSATGY